MPLSRLVKIGSTILIVFTVALFSNSCSSTSSSPAPIKEPTDASGSPGQYDPTTEGDQGAGTNEFEKEAPVSILVNDFSFNEEVVSPSDTVILTWDIQDVDSVEIQPDIGNVTVKNSSAKGNFEMVVTETKTYTLIAIKNGHQLTIKRTISVLQPPEIKQVSINTFSCPLKVLPKQPFEIHYAIDNAIQVELNKNSSHQNLNVNAGSLTETITGQTTYTLVAMSESGNKTASCTVLTREALCPFHESCKSHKGLSQGLRVPDGISVGGPNGPVCVADTFNYRVLIWHQIPTTHGTPADVVLGQKTLNTNYTNQGNSTPTSSSFNQPHGVFCSQNKLVVADEYNHRVLYWDHIPTQNNEPATLVLGQVNGESSSPVYFYKPYGVHVISHQIFPEGCDDNDELKPNCICKSSSGQDCDQLFVTDAKQQNGTQGRVLIWNPFPTNYNQPANVILTDFPAQVGEETVQMKIGKSGSPWGPVGLVSSYQNKLIVTDRINHRIVTFKTTKDDNTSRASQDDWNNLSTSDITCFPNASCEPSSATPTSATTLQYPNTAFVTKLEVEGDDRIHPFYFVVADTNRARILAYPLDSETFEVQTQDNQVVLLGQERFDANIYDFSYGRNPLNFYPSSVSPIGDEGLALSDRNCSRAYIYQATAPYQPGETDLGIDQRVATVALGQEDLSGCAMNNPGPISASKITSSGRTTSDGMRYYFADDHRILVYDSLPLDSTEDAAGVIGQLNFESNYPNRSAEPQPPTEKTLNSIFGTHASHQKLLVADMGNHRVLIYDLNNFEYTDMAASWIIGQPDQYSQVPNYGGIHYEDPEAPAGCQQSNAYLRSLVEGRCPAKSNLFRPLEVYYDGQYIYVGDSNYRVLVFDAQAIFSGPTIDSPDYQMPQAIAVIGQRHLTANDNTMAAGIGFGYTAYGLAFSENRLFASDMRSGTDSIYVYNNIHTQIQNWQPDTLITPDITLSEIPGHYGLNNVQDVDADDNWMYVADRDHYRVLIYELATLENNATPKYVYGQWDENGNASLDHVLPGNSLILQGTLDHTHLYSPHGVSIFDDFLVISENAHNRFLILPLNSVLSMGQIQ
jgi:hypothetical protein